MNKYELKDLRYLNWSNIRQSSGTAGSYLKSYSFSNGKKLYYKLSYFDDIEGIFGYESINEIIACKLLDAMNIPHLDYKLIYALIKIKEKEYKTYLTASLDFKERGESKIALDNYYQFLKEENEELIPFLKRMGFIEDIYKMIVFDYIILNRDRHGANIEILYNKLNGNIRLAPIFDNGLSLLSPVYKEEDIKNYDIYLERKVNSFIGSSNLENNLNLVPKEYLDIGNIDIDKIFASIGINNTYMEKAKAMLKWRIKKLEDIRNKRQ